MINQTMVRPAVRAVAILVFAGAAVLAGTGQGVAAAPPVCWVDVDRTNALATRAAAQDGDFAAAVRKLLTRTCKAGDSVRGYVPYAANAPAGAAKADRSLNAYPDWTATGNIAAAACDTAASIAFTPNVPGFVCRYAGD
ncbi:hypothetical protein P7L78_08020 [Tistrella bauzanensis]|jgi:hypothetical protein|uniref:hypothetical protein n=1 Tax=Tistrella TaxID=171436 RepID=UPI0031F5F10E